jgi:hypothetical protein
LFFTDRRRAVAAGVVPGIDPADVMALFARRVALDGTSVLLDAAMRPVEPLSSWFRYLALMGRSPKTMRKYAYIALRLAGFLAQGGTEGASGPETDLLEYRAWRTREQSEPVSKATWEAEATAINGLCVWLADQGRVAGRAWRGDGRRDSLRNGVARDVRVRNMRLEQSLFFRDVGLAGQLPDRTVDRSLRGQSPHRSRAAVEVALLTGVRLCEWSTLLLPGLGRGPDAGRPGAGVEVRLSACATGQGHEPAHRAWPARVDTFAAGIIEPAKVTRSALQNAASIAALFFTIKVVVADKPKQAAAAASGGGMSF